VPVRVHAHGQQGMDVDDAAALADLQHQRVRSHERVRARVQRTGAERLHLFIQIAGHLADLRARQPGDPKRFDQLLHPPGADAEQVAGRHHAGQGRFRPAAAFQQPVREIRARPQLRDRDVQRAGPGVEVPVPVAVADIDPVRARHPIRRAAGRISLGGHERVDERGQHLPQQIRRRGRQLVVQKAGRVDTARGGHRAVSFRSTVRGLPKDHAVAASCACATPINRAGQYTTLPDATSSNRLIPLVRREIRTAGTASAAAKYLNGNPWVPYVCSHRASSPGQPDSTGSASARGRLPAQQAIRMRGRAPVGA
jgi:hypothetical protein